MRISDWSSDVCSSDLVVCLSFCWRDIADGFEQTVIVEPGHPFQRGQFHRGLGFPRCPSMDQLGLVEAVDGLGEGIVIAVAAAADRRLDNGLPSASYNGSRRTVSPGRCDGSGNNHAQVGEIGRAHG